MNLNHFEAIQTVQKLYWALEPEHYRSTEISLHVPFTDIRSVQTLLEADAIPIKLGAQDCHWDDKGPFTGEVSPAMLMKLNVAYVIVGHSERRRHFNETDEVVSKKAAAAHRNGMVPIVCVGESTEEREQERSEDVIAQQVAEGLSLLKPEQVAATVIAYEPLWAISTASSNPTVATPQEAQDMCSLIRSAVESKWGQPAGEAIRVQYGGSVNGANARELLSRPDIDGALVGGASLIPEDFVSVVAAASR